MPKKRTMFIGAAIAIVLAVALAAWFQPWRLFSQSEVVETLPSSAASGQASKILLEGDFISHEHETTGKVRVLSLEGGSRILRIEGLITSDGPDLEVWLSDAPVREGIDGWFLFDDGRHESLGKLKATSGDQNYKIPDNLDLARFTSVSIWCVRFSVSFGAAELDLVR